MLVDKNRINKINEAELKEGNFVAYWMQSSQRLEYNQALGYAVEKANQFKKPLFIFFLIDSSFPEAEYSHFEFMAAGLKEIQQNLNKEKINFQIYEYQNITTLVKILKDALLVVSEKVYLKHLKEWKSTAAARLNIPFYLIESNLLCPIEEVSSKEEYAAYTIRKKINKIKDKYLKKYQQPQLKNKKKLLVKDEKLKPINDLDKYLSNLDFKDKRSYKKYFKGGYLEAKNKMNDFLENKLKDYAEKRNIPELNYQSDLSPYLHFGQISAQEIALAAQNAPYNAESFLEELIVRRELAFNFVYYNQNYNQKLKDILSNWAYQSLNKHRDDQRKYNYSYQELESAETHDKYWNAAQKELIITGKMHNYMRMYWGKKILEWTSEPETAYRNALKLNNKYALDGRDPNSYAGIAWCFGKHDRAWKERKIYGKVRYMNANGLERKFKMDKYLSKINKLSCSKAGY